MIKKTVLLFSSLCFTFFGITQQISANIISPAGEVSKTNSLYLEWTLGEPVIEIGSSNKILYTQGFHQPDVKLRTKAAKKVVQPEWYRITILPNPVETVFKAVIEKGNDSKLYLELSDLNGRRLLSKTSTGKYNVIEFNVALYSSGMYTLLIRSANGSLYKTFKIIKAR